MAQHATVYIVDDDTSCGVGVRRHERTVKLHRTAITMKVRVRSAAELAILTRDVELFADL